MRSSGSLSSGGAADSVAEGGADADADADAAADASGSAADPSANVTAVWFGVMVGLNIQTSFLTPPFGFSLFYLRGVAPPNVKTTQIYKGAAAFIVLQLLGLAIAGVFPNLVNYLPNKTHLISETAPPPNNPKLQECLEDYLFVQYDNQRQAIESGIEKIQTANLSYLPDEYQERLNESYRQAGEVFARVEAVRVAEENLEQYSVNYRPLHLEVRQIQREMRDLRDEVEELDQNRQRLRFEETVDEARIAEIERAIAVHEAGRKALEDSIPDEWKSARAEFNKFATAEKRARQQYRQSVDDSYAVIVMLREMLDQTDQLAALEDRFEPLLTAIESRSAEAAMEEVEALEDDFNRLAETHLIVSKLSRARRALRALEPEVDKVRAEIGEAMRRFSDELDWRQRAVTELASDLEGYDAVIARTIGMRMQERLTSEQADSVASCLAVHKDLTLYF
ncbi:MAG TPA: TRAP transporter large permease subunit, partial [Gammaproteobacteria bacterium]